MYKNYTLPSGRIYSSLSKDYFIIISGVIFRKELFQKFGKFNENYNIIGDFDFIMKISSFSNAHSLKLPLINYRVHDETFQKLKPKYFMKSINLGLKKIKKLKILISKKIFSSMKTDFIFLKSLFIKKLQKNFGIFQNN